MRSNVPFEAITFAGCALILCFVGYCVLKSTNSSGEVKYCYIKQESFDGMQFFELHGYREWRFDRTFGKFSSFNDSVESAAEIKCEIK